MTRNDTVCTKYMRLSITFTIDVTRSISNRKNIVVIKRITNTK